MGTVDKLPHASCDRDGLQWDTRGQSNYGTAVFSSILIRRCGIERIGKMEKGSKAKNYLLLNTNGTRIGVIVIPSLEAVTRA